MTHLSDIFIIPQLMKHAAWSIVAGMLVVAVYIVILIVTIRGFYPKSTFSPVSIIVTVILSILLCFQSIPICAAFGLKSKLTDLKEWLNEDVIHPDNYSVPIPIEDSESKEIVEKAVEEFPIMGMIFSSGMFEGYDTSNLAQAICDEANSELNKMIWKMLLVSLLETAVAAFIIIKTLEYRSERRAQRRRAARAVVSGGTSGRNMRPGSTRRRR